MKKIKTLISLFTACTILCTGLAGCTPIWKRGQVEIKNYEKKQESSEEVSETETTEMEWEDALELAGSYIGRMSAEEKVGQLFILNLEQLDPGAGTYYEHRKLTKEMRHTLEEYHIGGVILFSRNIETRKQTKRLNKKLQKRSRLPLFIAVDEEGGSVARIASNKKMKTTKFPSAEEIGKNKDDDYTYQMAKTIGAEIGELGFNVDFAPVADVKTSELNSEIGDRSFGEDPGKVSKHVSAFVQGLHRSGVAATLKHFPGQGSSKGDTHEDSVDIDSNISNLRNVDFVPFQTGITIGADFIMMSHISVSKVTESSIPASMSDLMMQTILRDELGFQKLIITDAFDMASITEYYDPGEAASNAIRAGADIILMPKDFKAAYNEILTEVKSDKISRERLDDSVARILAVKLQRGILSEDMLSATEPPTPAPASDAPSH